MARTVISENVIAPAIKSCGRTGHNVRIAFAVFASFVAKMPCFVAESTD